MNNLKALHWFRQDLRLQDNPALYEASKHAEVLPIFILDDLNSGEYSMGDASRFWLHHSLNDLSNNLNQNLSLYEGDPLQTLLDIISRFKIDVVYWNRCYEPWRIRRDTQIKAELESKGILVKTFNGSLLKSPWIQVQL